MPEVYRASIEQLPAIMTIAKGFEQASQMITVDIDYCVATYTKFIKTGIGGVFGLEVDGKAVGGLGYVIADELHHPKKYAVETFWFVDPQYRGYGIKLLNAFESFAQEQGCDSVAMIHLVDSQPEQLERIYKKRGYTLTEKHYMRTLP